MRLEDANLAAQNNRQDNLIHLGDVTATVSPGGSKVGSGNKAGCRGDVAYGGQWHPGVHEPLVDQSTFDRVQHQLGGQSYRAHELTYASNLIECGHCGRPITGESITRQRKSGTKQYRYYHCAGYNAAGHPRVRLTESDLDRQVLGLFGKLRIEDEKVRDWFARVLRERTQGEQ